MQSLASDQSIVAGILSDRIDDVAYPLYHQYHGAVSAYVLQNGGSSQDADDVFQETIVAFIDLVQRGKFRGEATVKTLLIGIGRHVWYNEIRKRKSLDQRGAVYEKNKGTEEEDGSGQLYERELHRHFLTLLTRLGEPCRTILTLFYYENRSFKEIVQETGYENEQVVRNRKYKCMKSLADMIQDDPEVMEQVKLMYD
ncbi:RNA polymerase sigma factor [Dinghuibacter silviterrae]|uniref:RNA polymerase sigma factor (Sigma-70 family) n=1 Tax=Dinghuibacter silviterrae TaxID=1539049 RepID=A0A4V3GKU6_9BACT|nr:sigma-70 family RNA polymerase sigma factor [Dinghuibacter silviterrae]TDW97032.1 RNA polymerase sigma factor (sigma-70 family) [Dinghuibacter silviterrae]